MPEERYSVVPNCQHSVGTRYGHDVASTRSEKVEEAPRRSGLVARVRTVRALLRRVGRRPHTTVWRSRATSSDETTPLIYVSVPLAGLARPDAMRTQEWADLVSRPVVNAAQAGPWGPRVWSGVDLLDQQTEEQVFHSNSVAAWAWADALIVGAYHGGSTGVGIELMWACLQGLPILYLHAPEVRLSRLLVGLAREEADIRICQVENPGDIGREVESFLLDRRHVIEQHQAERARWEESLRPLQSALRDAWSQLSEREQDQVAAAANLTVGRASRLVGDISALSAAGLREVSELRRVLGLDATMP